MIAVLDRACRLDAVMRVFVGAALTCQLGSDPSEARTIYAQEATIPRGQRDSMTGYARVQALAIQGMSV